MAVFGLVAGALADRWGSRPTAVTGAGVIVAGLLLLAPLSGQWGAVDVAWRLAVLGVGVGLFNTPNMTMAMSSAPGELLGTAGASISLARQLGFAFGPALATAVWAAAGYTPAGMRAAFVLAAAVSVLAVLALARTWPVTAHPPAVAVEAAAPSPATSH